MVWPLGTGARGGRTNTSRQAAELVSANIKRSTKVQRRRDAERISISITGRQFILCLQRGRLDRLHSGTPHPACAAEAASARRRPGPLPFRRGEGESSLASGV